MCRSILTQLSLRSADNSQSANETPFAGVGSTVTEYVQKSTIHGVTYIGDNERKKCERIWWSIMIVCSFFCAIFLIYQAYRTMKENPIIESPALRPSPLWDIPFPAVTICPEIIREPTRFALNKTNWPEFAQKFLPKNMTDLPISSVRLYSIFLQNVVLQRSDQNNYDILTQFSPQLTVGDVGWTTFPGKANVTLQKTITSLGACLTFNMYDEKDIRRDGIIPSSLYDLNDKKEQLWSRDSGFSKGLPAKNYTYPFRAVTTLDSFFMEFGADSTPFARFNSEYVIILHAPDEIPFYDRMAEYTIISSEKFHFVEIMPRLVLAEGIAKYDPNVRECYYNHERRLKYYKTYTQGHCESECLADYVLRLCGCVPYAMPHFPGTKVCGWELECIHKALSILFEPEFRGDTAHAPIDDCNCLPTCTQLSYSYQVTQLTKEVYGNRTWLQVKNRAPLFTKNVRTELHSLSEFFSNCGGSLGLFLGVSTVSIVELIYFCTVRLYFHSKRSQRKNSSEESNQ